MKQNVLQIAGAFFLAVCAMILVTAFAQWAYIAIVGCIFAAAGAYCLYRGLHGLFSVMEQDRSEDHRFFQEQQDRLVRAITDLNTASGNRSEQLLKQQRDISDAMNENLEALVQKAEIIIEDLEDAGLSIDSLNKALVDSEECDVPMLSVIAELLKKLPTKIYDEEKELLKQQKDISDAMNENLEALVQKAEIIIEDLEDAGLSIDSLNKALVDSEGCDVPMLSVIAELLKKLPTKIYDEEKELLKQIKEAIHNEESAVTKQMSSLEAVLNTYMGNYQAYMERFSQLSEQDLQFINRLMENDDVR